MSERNFRRYIHRYEDSGLEGLLYRRMREISHKRVPVHEVLKLEALYKETDQDWTYSTFMVSIAMHMRDKAPTPGSRTDCKRRACQKRETKGKPQKAAGAIAGATTGTRRKPGARWIRSIRPNLDEGCSNGAYR